LTPQPITDEQLDALIEAVRPQLRGMMRGAFEKLIPVHFLEVGKIPLPSGAQWQVVLAVMTEPMAALVGATALSGFPAMQAAFEKLREQPATTGFSVPGAP
jgi:hypothetical protein